MIVYSPYLLTGEEAAAVYQTYRCDHVLFHPHDEVRVGDYRELIRFIEERLNYSVCLRLYSGFDHGLLDLPITKAVVLLVYMDTETEERPVLMAVVSYNPLKMEFKQHWRSPHLPESYMFRYRPVIS